MLPVLLLFRYGLSIRCHLGHHGLHFYRLCHGYHGILCVLLRLVFLIVHRAREVPLVPMLREFHGYHSCRCYHLLQLIREIRLVLRVLGVQDDRYHLRVPSYRKDLVVPWLLGVLRFLGVRIV